MRALALPLATLAVLSLSGCIGSLAIDADPDLGAVSVASLRVERVDTSPQEVAARVFVTVRLVNAEDPRIRILLDDEGCATMGPPSAPTTPVASFHQTLPNDRTSQNITFDETLRGSGELGLKGSVYVGLDAANSIGPIFGNCEEFSRVG